MSSLPAPSSTPADEPLIQPLCSIFRRFLKRHGLKFTPERAVVLDSVLGKEGVFEADQLLYEMRNAGHRVSKATIYRTLKHLKEARIINEVLLDSKQSHYQLSFGREPKGHLFCVESSRVVEFNTQELAALVERVCKQHGFDPISYRFVVYGISPEARAAEQAEHGVEEQPEEEA
jgi:Fur family ferric uptake transcriptional regulator